MPAEDGTGPLGMGPLTGGGWGRCVGYAPLGRTGPGSGRAFWGRGAFRAGLSGGRGQGRGGLGWRNRYDATALPRWARWDAAPAGPMGEPSMGPSREQEIDRLKDEAQWLQVRLDAIGKRMEELSQE